MYLTDKRLKEFFSLNHQNGVCKGKSVSRISASQRCILQYLEESSISTPWKLKPKLMQLYPASKGMALSLCIKICRSYQWFTAHTGSCSSLMYQKACIVHTATSMQVQFTKHSILHVQKSGK